MATVVSLTQTKIEELMSGWEGISLSQDEINAIVSQLYTDVAAQGSSLEDFNTVVLPALEADLAAGSIAVSDLKDNDIPNLMNQLDSNELAVTNLNTVTIPLLQTELSSNTDWILELNEVTLPDLNTRLDANNAAIDEFNTVTLPALNTRLDDAEAAVAGIDLTGLQTDLDAAEAAINTLNTVSLPGLNTRLTTAEGDVTSLEGRFPITGPDIAADAVTANKIAADAITAREIAAHAVTAAEIAADTITANEIAANAVTVNELAANAVTAVKIAADAVTAGKIAADAITAREIQADSVTASEIAANTITAAEIAADTITANQIATDAITANEIAANAVTATEIAANAVIAGKINAGAVTATTIATDAVTAGKIAADAITARELQADSVTASEIATGTITALEIAGGTITGDKIAADTIAVTKLIVSDLTNYAPDGNFADPTLATWDTTPGYLTRVDSAGSAPYVEVATDPGRHTFLKNKHDFEMQAGDEFFITMEISTPATNVDTLDFHIALEVYDVDVVSQLWRGLPSALAVLPNTDWTVIEGTIAIDPTETGLATARFNSYVTPSTTANQKLRVRKIQLRKRGGGELILDGSIQAQQLDVESVTSAVVNTGSIQSQLSMTGLLEINGADMGWSASEGLYLGEDVRLYGDDRTNYLEGDLVTSNISVKDGLSIGGDAVLNGEFKLANGIATPTGRMLLGQTWPKEFPGTWLSDGTTDYQHLWQGIIDYDANNWLLVGNYFGPVMRKINKTSYAWAGDLDLADWGVRFYPIGGFCYIPGTGYYVIGSDADRNGDVYIYKLQTSGTINKLAEKRITSVNGFGGKRVKLVTDGTKVGMIWANSSGNVMHRWYDSGLAAAVGSDTLLMSDKGQVHIGAAYWGPGQPGGTTRLWVSLYTGDDNMVRCYTTALARVATEDFPRAANSTVLGLAYDANGGMNRLVHFDKYLNFYKYSNYVNGGSLNAQYTFYDGDNSVYPGAIGSGTTMINGVDKSGLASGFHETAPSPMTTFTLSKRAWPTITSPPAQDELVTDVLQVDKANRLGIYAAVGATPRLQGGYQAVGVRTLPLTDALDTSSILAGASAVPSFSSASVPDPGRWRSGAEQGGTPIIDLFGSGNGRTGPHRWDANSRPLNHGNWSSVNVASIAPSTWSKRVGWVQRDNINATTHGISYSAGVFTVAQSGLYLISGGATFDNGPVCRRACAIDVNGVDVARSEVQSSTTTSTPTPTVTTVIYLPAGAQVSLESWHNASTNLPYTASEAQNFLSINCLAAY